MTDTIRATNCDRRAGHPGACLSRCAATTGCTEHAGHRGRCTTGTWGPLALGWADTDTERCAAAG